MQAAIVGCGMGGMAAAVALARRGVEVEVFEAFDAPRPVGSGLLLQPSGLAALRALGLADRALEAGARIEQLEGRNLSGRLIMDLDYRAWRRDGFGVGIHRGALFGLLLDAVKEAGVPVRTSCRIVRIEDRARPLLIDAKGGAHGPFDLCVVADGSASSLRAHLRPRSTAPVYPWGAVWANSRDPTGEFQGALRQLYHRAEVMMGILPIGRGEVSIFWSLPVAGMDAFFASDFEAWRARLMDLWPAAAPVLKGLSGHSALARAIYRDVSVGRWNDAATVLIGDAAHGTSPQLGQGANLSIIDGVELAEAVSQARAPLVRAVARYQAARRRQTSLYQLASRALTPMFQSRGPFWCFLRDWVFAPGSHLPFMQRLAASVLVGVARLGRAPRITRL